MYFSEVYGLGCLYAFLFAAPFTVFQIIIFFLPTKKILNRNLRAMNVLWTHNKGLILKEDYNPKLDSPMYFLKVIFNLVLNIAMSWVGIFNVIYHAWQIYSRNREDNDTYESFLKLKSEVLPGDEILINVIKAFSQEFNAPSKSKVKAYLRKQFDENSICKKAELNAKLDAINEDADLIYVDENVIDSLLMVFQSDNPDKHKKLFQALNPFNMWENDYLSDTLHKIGDGKASATELGSTLMRIFLFRTLKIKLSIDIIGSPISDSEIDELHMILGFGDGSTQIEKFYLNLVKDGHLRNNNEKASYLYEVFATIVDALEIPSVLNKHKKSS